MPTAGFHEMKLATVILYFEAMAEQSSPARMKWKDLQLGVMPDWMGVGVAIPLPGFVGVWPMIDMQIYYSGCQFVLIP